MSSTCVKRVPTVFGTAPLFCTLVDCTLSDVVHSDFVTWMALVPAAQWKRKDVLDTSALAAAISWARQDDSWRTTWKPKPKPKPRQPKSAKPKRKPKP